MALACLQNVLGSDLKADDVEVTPTRLGRPPSPSPPFRRLPPHTSSLPLQACVVRNDNLKFTRLTSEEIESQLTALAERDDDLVSRE